ncbi:MAG: hypothetical protein CME93_01290 [Hyphomonadaceae bacterium]|nr:hypothetical protein [Hyphomonadaceae bacterium]OUX95741.1 MAG: hypothetical protein CBB77_01030 [Hyphomonas sp. TMED17]
MKFKSGRLSNRNRLVNASQALIVLFLISACERVVDQPENLTPEVTSDLAPAGLTMPAVWDTTELSSRPVSVAVAGGFGSQIAIASETGSLQLFDFEGDRITDPVEMAVQHISTGRQVRLSDVPVTMFPGINLAGDIQLFLHSGTMNEPIPYTVDIAQNGEAGGLCSGLPLNSTTELLALSYWTLEAPTTLQTGAIVEQGDDLVFVPGDTIESTQAISACTIGQHGSAIYSAPVEAAQVLERNGRDHTILLDAAGQFSRVTQIGDREPLMISPGLSIQVPHHSLDISGTGDARTGGYPGGLIVLIGEIEPDTYRAVLVDPSPVTLDLFPDIID